VGPAMQFRIVAAYTDWSSGNPSLSGVVSSSIGGTNVTIPTVTCPSTSSMARVVWTAFEPDSVYRIRVWAILDTDGSLTWPSNCYFAVLQPTGDNSPLFPLVPLKLFSMTSGFRYEESHDGEAEFLLLTNSSTPSLQFDIVCYASGGSTPYAPNNLSVSWKLSAEQISRQ
jgi:hypothetical protein